MKIIQRGAEAIIYVDKGNLVKERIKKGYRIPLIDQRIRRQRTKREDSLIRKARRTGVTVPNIIEQQDCKIIMEYIDGKKIKDILNVVDKSERFLIYKLIGQSIAKMHKDGIVHGDLTTSNMILKDDKIYFIDFGLGKISNKVEDKGVDLYLLYEALKSTHFKHLNEAWQNILKAYKQNYSNSNDILNRIKKIEQRRRYK